MSFSRSQQADFRPLVDEAWKAVAPTLPADPKDKVDHRIWYEAQLMACVGTTTTVPLDRGRDYDFAMDHFERLADNGSTKWQQRADRGDFERICYSVFGKGRREIAGEPVTPGYLSGIAKQALRLPDPPALRTLSKPQLKIVTKALAIHANRHSRAA